MSGIESAERLLTELDYARLKKLVAATLHPDLAELLMGAEVFPPHAIAPDVVTMYSQVEIEDTRTRQRQTLVICYPPDADPAAGYISVLSPAAVALLGLRAGSTAAWRTPVGDVAARLLAVPFQPEATGDYVT